jgi:translation initiation factor 1
MTTKPKILSKKRLAKDKQKLRVQLDTKQRAGKVVTAVGGFVGSDEDREALG